jgi:hypothetical protein
MKSRFDTIFKEPAGEPDARTEQPPPAPAPGAEPPPALPPGRRRPGRPSGKKSDPAFEQVTAYVPRDLYGKVRGELWSHHGRKEFSHLVGELLAEWLARQPPR